MLFCGDEIKAVEIAQKSYGEKVNTLCLDIDDVLLDTECFMRACLSNELSAKGGILYEHIYGAKISDEDADAVLSCMSDYSKIPFMPGAEDGLKILRCSYDVVLCSQYMTEVERAAKERFADSLYLPIILVCDKRLVDFKDTTMVDDSTRNLNNSNANRKVCFYKKGNFCGTYNGELVFDWGLLLDTLIK